MDEMTLEVFDRVPEAERAAIHASLMAHNATMLGASDPVPLYIPLKTEAGEVDGGLVGLTRRGWLHVDYLFVPERLRGRGIAGQLLQMAEDEARKRGCKAALIDTANPAARSAYQRQGYDIIGTLDDYALGHSITWMRKML
ncbi:GNAT superfamily N-acetyltransferase [Agrobacterium vitis]|nr:GNAT superfamily N-acetyltransferase [Agrobacterium vitis]MBE1439519.1 GNAT superfamily N-acetyltransferase [Agrobacterium vitis]